MNWLLSLKPVLTIGQLDRLSNIFDNAGQVVFAILVLSPLIAGIDKANLLMLALAIIGVSMCWIVSVWLAKKGRIE